MPVLCSFDSLTQSEVTLGFPRPFIARPRLPHGIRHLDMDKNHRILVKSVIPFFTKDWANCRFIAWEGAVLHRGIDDVFALAPGDLDFLTGEHMRYLWKDSKAPAPCALTSSARSSLLPRLSSSSTASNSTRTTTGASSLLLVTLTRTDSRSISRLGRTLSSTARRLAGLPIQRIASTSLAHLSVR